MYYNIHLTFYNRKCHTLSDIQWSNLLKNILLYIQCRPLCFYHKEYHRSSVDNDFCICHQRTQVYMSDNVPLLCHIGPHSFLDICQGNNVHANLPHKSYNVHYCHSQHSNLLVHSVLCIHIVGHTTRLNTFRIHQFA